MTSFTLAIFMVLVLQRWVLFMGPRLKSSRCHANWLRHRWLRPPPSPWEVFGFLWSYLVAKDFVCALSHSKVASRVCLSFALGVAPSLCRCFVSPTQAISSSNSSCISHPFCTWSYKLSPAATSWACVGFSLEEERVMQHSRDKYFPQLRTKVSIQ